MLVVITVVQRNEIQLAAEGNAQIYKSHFERKLEGFLVIKRQNCVVGELGVFLIVKIILIWANSEF